MADGQQKREPPKRITKIKAKQGVYYFAWEVFQGNTSNWDQHTLSCKDQPRPELLERLQGLPDDFTLIPDKTCSDAARYKALGNGMAQPCADFIIKRIAAVMRMEAAGGGDEM
ncbi:MAG: DNA cytosine methyltransferase [Schwartzia sp.]|nr:DNA cytosine methyltransferase [Schwartzia sp. (in: firmicutes)]